MANAFSASLDFFLIAPAPNADIAVESISTFLATPKAFLAPVLIAAAAASPIPGIKPIIVAPPKAPASK